MGDQSIVREPRTDEIISKSTAKSGRTIVAISASILFVKFFGIELDNLSPLGTIKLTGYRLDLAALGVLLYLAYAHLTNWSVDRIAAPALFDMSTAFGDHPQSWDGPNPPLRGKLTNFWITLKGGFGYSVWTARMSLLYGLHMSVPGVLWIGAVVALLISLGSRAF
jgi:hypothetical protein